MTEVKDKDVYTIDLRPYFIDLRLDLVVQAEVLERQRAVNLKARPKREIKKENNKIAKAPALLKQASKKDKKLKLKEGKSILRSGVEYAVYAVIFVMLVWGTPLGLTKLLESDQPIASITSSSMWPVLKRGDIVFIKGVAGKEDISLKDIVVFENGHGFTIHRVVKLKDDTLVTRGDANNVDDRPVSYDKVVGKAVTWSNGNVVNIPQIGKFSQSVQNIKGKITKMFHPALAEGS